MNIGMIFGYCYFDEVALSRIISSIVMCHIGNDSIFFMYRISLHRGSGMSKILVRPRLYGGHIFSKVKFTGEQKGKMYRIVLGYIYFE